MKKTVIHILSMGHSGSTLIDFTLGQYSNVFSTGELKHLTWQLYREVNGFKDSQGMCTCLNEFRECSFWSPILNSISNELNISINDLPKKFKIKYFEKLSFHDRPFWIKGIRRIHELGLRNEYFSVISSLFLKKINYNNSMLYDKIFEITKKEYIIDSSKDTIKYDVLSQNNEIFPLIIIRNIDDLIKSKHINKDFKTVKRRWLDYYNFQVKKIIEQLDNNNYHIMSFEHFLNDPYSEMKKLSKKINIDMSRFSEEFNSHDFHLVAGNPMRYNNHIIIRRKNLDLYTYNQELINSGLSNFFIDKMM